MDTNSVLDAIPPASQDLEYKVQSGDLNRVQPDAEGKIPFKTFLMWWRGVDA